MLAVCVCVNALMAVNFKQALATKIEQYGTRAPSVAETYRGCCGGRVTMVTTPGAESLPLVLLPICPAHPSAVAGIPTPLILPR